MTVSERITPGQNKRLHQLLSELGIMDMKPGLVKQFSRIQSASSKDLLYSEAQQLIRWLESRRVGPSERERADRMRKRVISMLLSYDPARFQVYSEKAGRNVPRMYGENGIYAFVKRYGYLKKDLNDYSYKELPKLVSQIEIIVNSQKQAIHDKLNGK